MTAPFPMQDATPAELGLDASRLERLCDRIEADIAAGHHPGAQVAVAVLGTRATLSPEASRITAPMAEADRVTDLLITLREAGIALTEMSVQKPTLDEVFLTASTLEVMPVVRVDRQRVATGKPGTITRLLQDRYRTFVRRTLARSRT